MKTEYFLFIAASAFMHAFYNTQMRRAGGSRLFLVGMFGLGALAAVAVSVAWGDRTALAWESLPFVYGASFFYVLYQFMVTKAYQKGSVSALYPLTVLSHVFVPFWAYLFLSERISWVSGCGIAVTVAGAVLVKMDSLAMAEWRRLADFSRHHAGAGYALAASFFYSFGAILDKSRIARFSTTTYLTLILGFMCVNMAVFIGFSEVRACARYARGHLRSVALASVGLVFSFLFFRVALKEVEVSIAVPLRQMSVVFAILLGAAMLKERLVANKLIGSGVIIAGITLIQLGAAR